MSIFSLDLIQVIVNEINTQYIENIIFIMKSIMENYNSELGGEHLGQATIEPLMLSIVRYCMTAMMSTYTHITVYITMCLATISTILLDT